LSKVTQIRQRARTYLQKGKFDKAIEEYKRLTGMETKNPNYFNELGDIYLKAGDSVQAVSNFEKAVVNYQKVALYNNAVAVCKKILRIVPDRGDTIYKLGELRAKQKLGGEARVYFAQYLDYILANADSCGPEMNGKIDGILELVSENAEILEKAADALVVIGIKTGGLEIYCKLLSDAKQTGEGERSAAIEAKIDLLKQSMTQDEIELVETAIGSHEGDKAVESEGADISPAPPANDEPPVAVDAEQPPSAETEQGPEDVEAASDEFQPAVDEEESDDQEVSGIPETEEEAIPEPEEEKVYTVEEMESCAEPEPDLADGEVSSGEQEETRDIGETDAGDGAEDLPDVTQPDAADEQEPPRDGTMETEEAPEAPEGEAPGAEESLDEAARGQKEDLSSLLDDVRNADTAESLVEEITSDVEEDDFRSHYDLGMAYLEMALYTEAIKEFQVASRSEQIQIKSIEMIGHCFLMQNNPRLAVKQLLRGLELVKVANSESLGVHYNLGLAYELLGDMEKAREHYEEVYIVDISFRDIAEKMKKLSTVS
jgi:tetratricopeptide (TPR) repeat protein